MSFARTDAGRENAVVIVKTICHRFARVKTKGLRQIGCPAVCDLGENRPRSDSSIR